MKSIHTPVNKFQLSRRKKKKKMPGSTSSFPTFGIQRIPLVNRTLNIARI